MKTITGPLLLLASLTLFLPSPAAPSQNTFHLGEQDFLLNGKPLQIISGELHPARIPSAYWAHRLRMVHAMGCNTVALYIFWNSHEQQEGTFDFQSPQLAIGHFIRLAAREGLHVLVRPGPYTCGEWDFGGLPPYLLRHPDLKIRCMDPRYMEAVRRYIQALAPVIRPLQVTHGGPVLMLQIENEYGSYGNDRTYLQTLAKLWREEGIDIPFYTADGPTPHMLRAGTLDGAAVGLDSGSRNEDFQLARQICPHVPVFSSETYPGWLTHWGENWARPATEPLLEEVRFLLQNQLSLNFYVLHGGTNFGWSAGANSGAKGYQPDITSYDYDAPINEQGRPTPKYHALAALIRTFGPQQSLPPVPDPIPVMGTPPIPMTRLAPLLDHLPAPHHRVQPVPMEMLGQSHGLMLYRTKLLGRVDGTLRIMEPHDLVLVYRQGRFMGCIERRLGQSTLELPPDDSLPPNPRLDLLVEAMGHINFAENMIDRKGITERVSLSGMTLMNWELYPLPLEEANLPLIDGSAPLPLREGPQFFTGRFHTEQTADTYLDLGQWRKGLIWVNGHLLGRYWDIGPQFRLYCPAPFLQRGSNTVLILDLFRQEPAPLQGYPEPQPPDPH